LSKKLELILQDGTTENETYIKGWLGNDELGSSGLPETDDPIWKSLGYVYSQSWFTRLWVLQEVILAKKSKQNSGGQSQELVLMSERLVMVAHGTKQVAWEPFVALGKSFSTAALRNVLANTPEKAETLRRTLSDLRMMEIAIKRSFQNVQFFGLPSLLSVARSKGVTEPVDKIYGMLGMINPKVGSQIVVDYSKMSRKEWWKAYIQYGRLQLTSEGMLSLLTMAPSRERPQELPSWCPNFNSPPKDPASLGCIQGYQAGFESPAERIESRVITILNSTALRFHGFRVDKVHTVAGSPESCWDGPVTKGPSGIADRLLDYEKKCLRLSQQTYNYPNEVPEAHWRTLVADADLKGHSPLKPETVDDYLLCIRVWMSHRDDTQVDLVDSLNASERQRVLSFRKCANIVRPMEAIYMRHTMPSFQVLFDISFVPLSDFPKLEECFRQGFPLSVLQSLRAIGNVVFYQRVI
jgi:hypothetical protein